MFYCNECAENNGFPETIIKSEGRCELCGKHRICNDCPSSKLPKIKNAISVLPKSLNFSNKNYPVIDVPASGKPDWSGGAFVLCFVYSKQHGNFILRGYVKEVQEYLKQHYTHYFYYLSMWNSGRSRGYWCFWKDGVSIFPPVRRGKNKKRQYIFRKYHESGHYNDLALLKLQKEVELRFKRLPKQWIPEFNQL